MTSLDSGPGPAAQVGGIRAHLFVNSGVSCGQAHHSGAAPLDFLLKVFKDVVREFDFVSGESHSCSFPPGILSLQIFPKHANVGAQNDIGVVVFDVGQKLGAFVGPCKNGEAA